jgi:aldose 1-epimerase
MTTETDPTSRTRVSYQSWGQHQGKEVYLFRLEHHHGSYVELTNYGATLVSLVVPDNNGTQENVVLGFPSLAGYVADRCYLGATIGRFANRIKGASFQLDGNTYRLDPNDQGNTNHGGQQGFHGQVFDFTVGPAGVSFTLTSTDQAGGFPGNLQVQVTYTWNDRQELAIQYHALTDKKTVVNFTNHAYFNLAPKQGPIFSHVLTIPAQQVLEMAPDYVPTGAVVPAGPVSFDQDTIGSRQSQQGPAGLNAYYILDPLRLGAAAATLYAPLSGRQLEVFTTYPGLLVYTGGYLSSSMPGHGGACYQPFEGLCLECQHFPDAPNQAHFPSTVLEAGQAYHQEILLKFSVRHE